MNNDKRLYSFPATMAFKILAHTAEEAKETLEQLILNLGRFDDLSLVEGEMDE